MTRTLDSDSLGDRRRTRRYLIEFLIGIVAYAVLLAVAIPLAAHAAPPLRWIWAGLPALPAVWIAIAVVRHLGRSDELQRLRALQGLSVGFVAAMLTAITIGLLEPAGLDVPGAPWWIYAAGMGAWLITTLVQRAR